MNIFTEKNFQRLIDFQELIEEKADNLLNELNEIKAIEDYKYLSFNKVGYDIICYTGYDSYRQEEKYYSLPLQLLYDEEYKQSYIQKIKDEVEQIKKQEAERKEAARLNQLKKEREQYEALKAKFENS